MAASKVRLVLKHSPDEPVEVSEREAESLARQGLVLKAAPAPAAKTTAKETGK